MCVHLLGVYECVYALRQASLMSLILQVSALLLFLFCFSYAHAHHHNPVATAERELLPISKHVEQPKRLKQEAGSTFKEGELPQNHLRCKTIRAEAKVPQQSKPFIKTSQHA
jgi:hypothetical protein